MARIMVNLKSATCCLFMLFVSFSCKNFDDYILENIYSEDAATRAYENNVTPYFYYYDGEKQYFELDTKRVFISMSDEAKLKEYILNASNNSLMRFDTPKKVTIRVFG